MPQQYWAKYDEDTKNIHLLEHHLADVGAVMKSLLSISAFRRAAAKASRIEDLDPTIIGRLCVFAALHDIGKINLGFQAKINKKNVISHTKDLMPLLNGSDNIKQDQLMESIRWLNDALSNWDDNDGITVCGMLIAMLSHHGQPERLNNGHYSRTNHWHDIQDKYEIQPFEKIAEIAKQIEEWFPAAFQEDAPKLPNSPEFQHYFLGLLMLADWIGSDIRFFPFKSCPDQQHFTASLKRAKEAIDTIGLRENHSDIPKEVATLSDILGIAATPNAMQSAIGDIALDTPLAIIESETGSGKTEAALIHFQRLYRAGLVGGMYFALPTRAAATQIHRRVTDAIKGILPGSCIEPVLAIPGYIKAGENEGTALPKYRVHWEDGPDDGSRWAAERSKRYLTAQVAVGTVDQAMLSILQTKHSHLRAVSLSRHLLVIDEVHASDTYMRGIIQALVRNHTSLGGKVLMMSATLGSRARASYLEQEPMADLKSAINVLYPSIATENGIVGTGQNEQQKSVHIQCLSEIDDITQIALSAQKQGAKVLIIRNTVRLATETMQQIGKQAENASKQLLTVSDIPVAHHSRFAPEDRKLLDEAVEAALSGSSPGGVIVIGTQTVEQSLDIDADLLITDLCPVDVLLQRIGRLHRKRGAARPEGYVAATCKVIVPEGEITELIEGKSDTGLGPKGNVYQDLRIIEATKRQMMDNPIWRIPEMNRCLVENSTHPSVLNSIVSENPQIWADHDNYMEGAARADTMIAENVIADWSVPFYDGSTNSNDDVIFTDNKVMTRLAEPTIEIEFEEGTVGPFGISVSKIGIPYWMIGQSAADVEEAKAGVHY